MKRQKDCTQITCRLCQVVVLASGMPSHLQHKHNKLTSQEYVDMFGEFRQKYLKSIVQKQESIIVCEICKEKQISHKALLHHLHQHSITWQDYFIKYFFKGVHPLCNCGCGQKVTLIRSGKNDKKEPAYAREMLPGHHKHSPGYRSCTPEQKETMRLSAIERMKKGEGTFFNSGPSKGEQELQEYVSELVPDTVYNDKTLLAGKEIDILLPSHKIAIEYNGGYFHSELFKDKNYHLNKLKEVEKKGYRIIHIWESDWYLNPEIVKSNLKNILQLTETKIYARKAELKEISSQQANTFCNENHLQSSAVSKVRIGLFYNNELVSVMTFSSLRKATGLSSKQGCYELLRFCNKKNTTVIGGASKMFSYFKKKYGPTYIISYANRDWSQGNLYQKLEMTYKGNTPPGYFYVKSKHKFSRFQFQKHKLVEQGADPTLTEYEIMLERGYYRIWDCGNLRFEWKAS